MIKRFNLKAFAKFVGKQHYNFPSNSHKAISFTGSSVGSDAAEKIKRRIYGDLNLMIWILLARLGYVVASLDKTS